MGTSSACRAVLFDLDGTLLDTAPDMGAALNALLREHGRAALPPATIRPHVSHGSTALVRLGFPDVPESGFIPLRDRFLALYASRLANDTAPFPGMPELLATLAERRVPWGIVTNKPGWLTAPLLAAIGLRERAAVVVSGDTLPERKPHPLPLLHAAERMGVAPGECLYVGDAERDALAARAAGMRMLVARFGYIRQEDRIDEWPAHGWIDAPAEVLDWLDGPPPAAG